jgi:hypothetical protein
MVGGGGGGVVISIARNSITSAEERGAAGDDGEGVGEGSEKRDMLGAAVLPTDRGRVVNLTLQAAISSPRTTAVGRRVSGKTATYGTVTLSATGPTLLPIAEATIFGRVLFH